MNEIGQGNYGSVYRGVWRRETDGIDDLEGLEAEGGVEVAVKLMKGDVGELTRQALLQEASLMVQFKHPNLIHMLGVCWTGKVRRLRRRKKGRRRRKRRRRKRRSRRRKMNKRKIIIPLSLANGGH